MLSPQAVFDGLPESVINSVILAASTVLVAIVGLLGALFARRRRVDAADDDGAKPVVPSTPLSEFSGTQNEFMELVIRDNAEMRSRLEAVERAQKTERARHNEFRRAVRGYLTRLASEWPGSEPMPWPDEPDLVILEDTLPRFFRPRPRSGS